MDNKYPFIRGVYSLYVINIDNIFGTKLVYMESFIPFADRKKDSIWVICIICNIIYSFCLADK